MRRKYLNCWEYQRCGKEPGGARSSRGVCPAALETTLDGANHGNNGGRSCWVVSGTLCNGRVHGSYEDKACECRKCAFMTRVEVEESLAFESDESLLSRYAVGSRAEQVG